MGKLTPMMQQYKSVKEQYEDCIVFYRLGDFYEMFFDDAITASRELEIALTGRDCGLEERAPMCGVPFHAANGYIAKLIEKGYRVAICEQVEDASEAKGLVKREVIRVITPGTIIEESFLDEKSNNYLMAIYRNKHGFGIAVTDISTGYFSVSNIEVNHPYYLLDEIAKYQPKEIIINPSLGLIDEHILSMIEKRFKIFMSKMDNDLDYSQMIDILGSQFPEYKNSQVKEKLDQTRYFAAALLLEYLNETHMKTLFHINKLETYDIEGFMKIDINTRRNLELTETLREKQKNGSLYWVMDQTCTSMGSRMLRRWIEEPLTSVDQIIQRQNLIQTLFDDTLSLEELRGYLNEVYDLERLIGRISLGTANPKDIIALKNSLRVLPQIKEVLRSKEDKEIEYLDNNIDSLDDIFLLIDNSINDEAPFSSKDGGIIKDGYSVEIDRLRDISKNGKAWIAKQEAIEREKTGIKSIKIGYNKVFGYYIELTKSHVNNAPDYYIRKQTLANCERYITPELKEIESEILGAEDKLISLEYRLFCEIRDKIYQECHKIQQTAFFVSYLDSICSLAKIAILNNYVRPEVLNGDFIDIKEGRHPVVERKLNGELFVPNDTVLDNEENRVCIITGPNMAGKSTYMRQTALLVLMAQIGSFIPCRSAKIGIVDRIFTRVGASDDLAQGQSTFMVEMNEVAHIMHNATKDSLVILDEIGRGTSTYDGLSIAWAVVEYISDTNKIGCKTLFATHYHELTELEGKIPGVKNYCISVKERGEDIIFLRRIILGGADKSYGIHVARLAGLPEEIINNSKKILHRLEESDINRPGDREIATTKEKPVDLGQMTLFNQNYRQYVEKISKIDVSTITPIEAMNLLYNLINEAKKI